MKYLIVLILAVLAHAHGENSQVLKDFSTGYNRFSAGVYKELLKTNSGNFLVCPLSVDIVLALISSGAKGKTSTELTSTLHLPEAQEKVKEVFSAIAPNLKSTDKYELSSANKVYLKPGFEISKDFKDTAVNSFGAELENVDFFKTSEAAAKINQWVEGKTHNKIKELIKEKDLNNRTRSVLVNAIYFHGKWVRNFYVNDAEKKPFYINDKDHVDIPLMAAHRNFDYYECTKSDAKYLRLPYQGEDVSLHIVLPNKRNGLAALEEKLEDVLEPPKYTSEDVRVEIPKWKIESSIEFRPILEALGIKTAFNDDEADFTGIAADKQRLVITKVIQKTFIEVDEKGTTAAAATGVIAAVPISAHIPLTPPKEFRADHPFLFYLRLDKLGVNLFVGTYKVPSP